MQGRPNSVGSGATNSTGQQSERLCIPAKSCGFMHLGVLSACECLCRRGEQFKTTLSGIAAALRVALPQPGVACLPVKRSAARAYTAHCTTCQAGSTTAPHGQQITTLTDTWKTVCCLQELDGLLHCLEQCRNGVNCVQEPVVAAAQPEVKPAPPAPVKPVVLDKRQQLLQAAAGYQAADGGGAAGIERLFAHHAADSPLPPPHLLPHGFLPHHSGQVRQHSRRAMNEGRPTQWSNTWLQRLQQSVEAGWHAQVISKKRFQAVNEGVTTSEEGGSPSSVLDAIDGRAPKRAKALNGAAAADYARRKALLEAECAEVRPSK